MNIYPKRPIEPLIPLTFRYDLTPARLGLTERPEERVEGADAGLSVTGGAIGRFKREE